MSDTIRSGIVEQCRVLAISTVGDVICQTPTRHTRVGLEKARRIINWQSNWLKRNYSELATHTDVTYKLQWFVDNNWTDHESASTYHPMPRPTHKEPIESSKTRNRIQQFERNLGPRFTALRKAAREATREVIAGPPPVPSRIRNFARDKKIAGWTNKFSLMPEDPNLYSESLRADWKTHFDDWKGRILLLSKDPCPTEKVAEMVNQGVPFLHRAQNDLGDEKGFRTNNRLYDFVSAIPGGKLFGSACANMLYDKPGYVRELPPEFFDGPLHDYLKDVLGWVIETMPRVKWIACLGKEAWILACSAMGDSFAGDQFGEYRDAYQPKAGIINGNRITAFPLFHPGARGRFINEMPKGWRIFTELIAKSAK